MEQSFDYMVICDFDGTITNVDTFWALMKSIYTDEKIEEALQPSIDGEIRLIDACYNLVGQIKSTEIYKFDDFMETTQIRSGFDEFLDFLDCNNIPIVVLSGGLDYAVRGRLKDYMHRFHNFFCAHVDTSNEYLTVTSPADEQYSFLDKSTVLSQLKAKTFIGIGDGVTDITIANICDYMFARDELYNHMSENNLNCLPWNDFHDVIRHMKNHVLNK